MGEPEDTSAVGPQTPDLEMDALYRAAIQNAPIVVYIDRTFERAEEDVTLFISEQIDGLLGWTPEEWLARPGLWLEIVHPDDLERVLAEAGEATTGFDHEYRIKHRDGHWLWVREMARIIGSRKGEGDLWHGVFLDVTESKEAEARVRAAEEQLRSLVANIPAVVYLDPIDENERTIYISPKIESLLGVTPEEWIENMSIWREMVHPDDQDSVWESYEDYRESGEPQTTEYRMIRRDGRTVWIREKVEVLRDIEGNPLLIQGIMEDITEERRGQEVRDFQARLLESISDAVIACDSDWLVTSWNRAAETLYGWPASEMIGSPLPEDLHHDPATLATIWDPFVEELGGWRGTTTHQDRDGYVIQIETKGLPLLDAKGDRVGYVMVNREVAEA